MPWKCQEVVRFAPVSGEFRSQPSMKAHVTHTWLPRVSRSVARVDVMATRHKETWDALQATHSLLIYCMQ